MIGLEGYNERKRAILFRISKRNDWEITSNTDNWTSFLRTMSRNYEFTYPEQVMIYAQRPNATFCKPYEDWNAENYRRYVKRGSTGIALFVMNRDKPYLRYVFDVADTGVRRSSPELKPWEVTPENRSYVMEAMERTFGVAADGVLEAQLEDIASALAAEYWDDYKKQFLDIVANSFLEEYDELNIEVAFKNAVANSVSYTMYCRFVESPDNYFEHEDFQKVFDFNTRQTVNALGTAVNAISTRMFQEIEKRLENMSRLKLPKGVQIMSEMTYRQAGDYQIPNLQLENEGEKPLGKYGRMRRAFLEQNNPMLLNDMILTESLFPHLWEIEETAKARVEFLMEQYLKDSPAPDKETQQMAWVQHMNSLKAQAEEVVMTELINS